MRKIVFSLCGALLVLLIVLMVIDKNQSNSANYSEVVGVDEAKANLESVHDEKNPVATITLSADGKDYPFTFELFPDKAPESVKNFIALANDGFYDGLTMHRLIQDFVIQGGDPEGNGSGGPGYTIKGEFPANEVETGLTHQVGALAWARGSGNDTAGSQFYIVLNDGVQSLDPNYAVFGYMVEGYESLEYFNNLETTEADVPVNQIKIKSVTVDTKGVDYELPTKISDSENLDEK